MILPRLGPFTVIFACLTGAGFPPFAAGADPIDFDRQVRPIFAANCLSCHGAEKQRGGLRLDNAAAAREGGNSGAVIVPGQSAESKLIHAVAGHDPDTKMPPGEQSLTAADIEILRKWIDAGANWGRDQPDAQAAVVKSDHWAFQPVRRPAVPQTRHSGHNPIDAFILTRLEAEGLSPSPEAEKVTLCRRLYLDLIGLPPSPQEVDEFLKDPSPDAYEKLVDRLLASPHYGERWGRHWLDLARYADSDGYEKDAGRPFAWRYRDWVIQALNRDLPFDQFTIEQLAGDLLPNATVEQKIATGFHRNTLTNKEGGVDQEEFRVAAVMDRVNTTGTVWLGLTVGCAQCHDHKYDPLSQREYYRLLAFFNSDQEVDLPVPLPGEEEKLQKQQAAFDAKKAELQQAVDEAKQKGLPAAEFTKRESALLAHLKTAPTYSRAQTLALGPPRPTHVLIRGDFLRKGVEVAPGTPAVLPPLAPPQTTAAGLTRLDLARWLVCADNPLTPRVIVNWVWSKYFGRGLVATPEDFGIQGQKPSHPELLDWLASEFVNPTTSAVGRPWSLKRLHLLIVTSAAYRQSSALRPDLRDRDPLNVLLARQSRLRLEAEIVRDIALAASGLLTRTIGGPSIRPPQPPGISELTYANSAKWVESTGPDRYKRGMYIWFQRTSPYPMLMTFDEPDSNVCTVRRERSNTPLQALTLLNDAVFVEAAQALAKRSLTEQQGQPPAAVVDHLFRLGLGREPQQQERQRLLTLHAELTALARDDPAEAAKLLGAYKPDGVSPDAAAAWVGVARAVMNLDEFVTRE
jgi:mono/diheme cytochrome c family protein